MSDNKKTIKEEEQKKSEIQNEEFKKQVEELDNKYKRALADYQNLEKRTISEKRDFIKIANKDLLLRFLPVLDTLILAEKHIKDQGISISVGQFLDALKAEGVEKIETNGKKFNPELMECVETEEGEEGLVLEEIRSGYKLYDKVLRPAMVKVGKQKVEKKEEEEAKEELRKGDYT